MITNNQAAKFQIVEQMDNERGEHMNQVNKTLYIPLYGKSYVSRKGIILRDEMAEKIWKAEGFELKGKSKSKWLAYFLGIRSAVFDEWVTGQMAVAPNAVVIQIGCGMDSRIMRVEAGDHKWYDVDFPDVIRERKRYYAETDHYKMLAEDVRNDGWLAAIQETETAIVIMEGVSMYLTDDEMRKLTDGLCAQFKSLVLLVDAYTAFAAKMSKARNPINDVGVTEVYGIESPKDYESAELVFVTEHSMTPQKYINELKGLERFVFAKLYAGSLSKKLYRLLEYRNK